MVEEVEVDEDEQPKDFVVPSFEDALEQGYQELNVIGKLTYHLQDYIWSTMTVLGLVSYYAGVTYGKFW